MQSLNKQFHHVDELPERVIQFGEGNFLRGFIDWMIHQMNKKGLFNGRVVAIQPTPHGKVVPKLNAQDGLYTVVLRGVENGEIVDDAEIVSSISRGINPYEDWNAVLKVAESEAIQFVFSNTTEAGLSYLKEEQITGQAPLSFPGKLTALLYHRFQVFKGSPESGLVLFPCELLENNGDRLRENVLQIAVDWNLPTEFAIWLKNHNQFCNTLVDRIVTGYPKDNQEEFRQRLGYDDQLLTIGEPFHLFAIEAGEEVAERIPFHQAGLNVHWGSTDSFRKIKVRILNGAHTMTFAAAFLAGKDTVLDAMKDETIKKYIVNGIYEEIMPALDLPENEKRDFAHAVLERFQNPFTKHYWLDIGLSAVFKYKTRLLPSLTDYLDLKGELPTTVSFSLAALLLFYRGEQDGNFLRGKRDGQFYSIRDHQDTLALFRQVWDLYDQKQVCLEELVVRVLGQEAFWDRNLNEICSLSERVYMDLSKMLELGMEQALLELVQ
jgi:tagaturonate reductase